MSFKSGEFHHDLATWHMADFTHGENHPFFSMFVSLLEHPFSIDPVIAWEQGWSPSNGYQHLSTLSSNKREKIMSRHVTEFFEYMNSSLHAFSPTRYWQSLPFPPRVAPRMVSLLAACTEDRERGACGMLMHVSMLQFWGMRVWALLQVIHFGLEQVWNKYFWAMHPTDIHGHSFIYRPKRFHWIILYYNHIYVCTYVLALRSWFVFVCSSGGPIWFGVCGLQLCWGQQGCNMFEWWMSVLQLVVLDSWGYHKKRPSPSQEVFTSLERAFAFYCWWFRNPARKPVDM